MIESAPRFCNSLAILMKVVPSVKISSTNNIFPSNIELNTLRSVSELKLKKLLINSIKEKKSNW